MTAIAAGAAIGRRCVDIGIRQLVAGAAIAAFATGIADTPIRAVVAVIAGNAAFLAVIAISPVEAGGAERRQRKASEMGETVAGSAPAAGISVVPRWEMARRRDAAGEWV